MKTTDECVSILCANSEEFKDVFGVRKMFVFGSVSRGEHTEQSDVDVFVDMPPRIMLLSGLKLRLEALLHAPVDLIRRHKHLSGFFLEQIKRDGIRII